MADMAVPPTVTPLEPRDDRVPDARGGTPPEEPDAGHLEPPTASSRRSLLAAGLSGLAGLVLGAFGRPATTDAAAGSALIIGRTTNNAGTSATTLTTSSTGAGLRVSQNGSGQALQGVTVASGAYGVWGQNTGGGGAGGAIRAAGGNNVGVVASTASSAKAALSASNTAAAKGAGAAIIATGGKNDGIAATSTSGSAAAVRATNTGTYTGGMGGPIGVFGTATLAHGFGVVGQAPSGTGVQGISDSGAGVYGGSSSGDGVHGSSDTGYALYGDGNCFVAGDLSVNGTVDKAGGTFRIDHPTDPSRKYLQHSFVESPDMKNVYDGTVRLDAAGEATVELPGYFEALNRDTRVQLTPIGSFSPLYVKAPVTNGRFRIAGGGPRQEVFWQVTGIRRDPWAKAHPVAVEVAKRGVERGRYLHPALYGEPAGKAIIAATRAKAGRPSATPRP